VFEIHSSEEYNVLEDFTYYCNEEDVPHPKLHLNEKDKTYEIYYDFKKEIDKCYIQNKDRIIALPLQDTSFGYIKAFCEKEKDNLYFTVEFPKDFSKENFQFKYQENTNWKEFEIIENENNPIWKVSYSFSQHVFPIRIYQGEEYEELDILVPHNCAFANKYGPMLPLIAGKINTIELVYPLHSLPETIIFYNETCSYEAEILLSSTTSRINFKVPYVDTSGEYIMKIVFNDNTETEIEDYRIETNDFELMTSEIRLIKGQNPINNGF
jgi:hypothetical protein